MKTYKELYTLIEQEIIGLKYNKKPDELYQPIEYMLSLGGKRLRPVLVVMAADMFGVEIKKAIPAALAVEVFHNFTLVHDDIMDKANIRRGQLTVHKKWDEPVAILSGDLMMIKAMDLLCETEIEPLRPLISLFNKTAAEVCEGQQLDMNFEKYAEVAESDYIEMITLKTAVLLGCSLQIGAMVSGASPDDQFHVYEFGKNMGIAFQIQDDILDSFGEGDKVGKKIGGDIASNKKTLLLIEALQCAIGDDLTALKHWITVSDNEQNKIEAVLNIYNKYDVRGRAENLKEHYLQEAFMHLSRLSLPSERTIILKQTAVDLMERMS